MGLPPKRVDCRLCGIGDVKLVIDLGEQPLAHRLQDASGIPEVVHPLTLSVCERCSLLQIAQPVPPDLLYANYNWFTAWKPRHLVRVTLDWLIEARVPTSARVVEIGSNDGTFLAALRDIGYERLLGIEPAADACAAATEQGIRTLRAFLTLDTAPSIREQAGPADLIVVRQVLEHIEDLRGFGEALASLAAPGALLVIELPDFEASLKLGDYSTIWEEHVNYFTEGTLRRFLADTGANMLKLLSSPLSGGTLLALAQFDRTASTGYEERRRADTKPLWTWGAEWPRHRRNLVDYLASERRRGRRIALYGAGWRSHALINFHGIGEHLDAIVDDRPAKIGKYMPGAPVPVSASNLLTELPIDLCLLAVNAENEDLVIGKHGEFVRGGGRFESLLPPSPRLVAPLGILAASQ